MFRAACEQLVINKETQMADNFSRRIVEGRPYSYGSAPVSNFQVVYRPLTPEQRRARILEIAQSLCAAEIAGKPWDVRLFADRLVESVMLMRAGAE